MKTRILIIILAGDLGLRADTPIQLSLTPDIALYPSTTMVRGFSLGIWGQNPETGLTLGLVNGSTSDSGGLSWGVVNYAESYKGVQWGVINISTENFIGWQHGYVNIAQGTFKGFEFGFINAAENATGFQLGAVNYAQQLHGLQVGLINVVLSNPCFAQFPDKLAPGFPVLNWSF